MARVMVTTLLLLCCRTHEDEGEGEGAQWHVRTRVTTTTTMLLPLHNNIVVVVVVVVTSPLLCSWACKNGRARAFKLAGFGE